MDKQQALEALRVIIVGSPSAFREAGKTIQALHANSPVIQQRLNFVGSMALNDLQADFTPDERGLIASVMGLQEDSDTTTISFKLTKAERAEVERLAQAEGYENLSAYIRLKIGLTE
jgi:hypothetical protein